MKKLGATVLLWAGCLLGFALGFAVVAYVHENWPSLEEPAIFTFLALGAALGVVALRVRVPRIEKIAGWAGIACLGLSAGFAIFHGWGVAVQVIFGLAIVAFVGFFISRIRRLTRSAFPPDSSRPIVAHRGAPSEQAILADAAEPYILYSAKWKIARILLILLVITIFLGVATAWIFTTYHDTNSAFVGILLTVFVALCSLACLAFGYRLISRKPSLIMTHLGLIDKASGIFNGAGPIRWEEINHAVILDKSDILRPTLRYLAIVPENTRSLMRRLPLSGRFLLKLFSPSLLTGIAIYLPEFMLPVPLETVIEQIEFYARGGKARRLNEGPPGEEDEDPAADTTTSE